MIMMPDYGEIKSSEGILVIEYIFYAKKKKSILTRWAKPTYSVVVDVDAKSDPTSIELKNNTGILGLECSYPRSVTL